MVLQCVKLADLQNICLVVSLSITLCLPLQRFCIFNFRHLIFVADPKPDGLDSLTVLERFEHSPNSDTLSTSQQQTPITKADSKAMEKSPASITSWYNSPVKREPVSLQRKLNSATKRKASGSRPTTPVISPDQQEHFRQTTILSFYNVTPSKRARTDEKTPTTTSLRSPRRTLTPPSAMYNLHQLETPDRRCLVPMVKRLQHADIVALQQRVQHAAANDRSSSVSSSTTSSSVCSAIITNLRDLQRLSSARMRHKSTAASGGGSRAKQTAAASGDTTTTAEDEFTVESVLKINEIDGEPHFLVKWRGWSVAHNTWEPLAHVRHCDSFKQFIAKQILLFQPEIEQIAADCAPEESVFKSSSSTATISKDTTSPTAVPDDAQIFASIRDFDECRIESQLLLVALLQRNEESKTSQYKRLMVSLRRDLVRLPGHLRRMQQLDALRAFEQQINAIDKSANLTVENLVDFEGPPADFVYVNERFAGKGVHIPDDPIIGCDCAGTDGDSTKRCSASSECCGKNSHSQFAYNYRNSVRVPRGTPIFECNRRCSCGPECRNRVVQKGRKHSLCIYKTPNGCGWGVRTLRAIAQGQFICEYVGEILTYEETEKRGRIYDAEGRTYLFDLDMNSNDNPYTIDAAHHGNVSHFINHSCDPNSGVWAVWIDCMDLDLPRIALFALRRIEAGEELSIDYMNQSAATGGAAKVKALDAGDAGDSDDETDVCQSEQSKMQMACKCGTAKCRKYVF